MLRLYFAFVFLSFIFLDQGFAAKIQFPEDELASESVFPKFDNPVPVRSRNIVTDGRVELTALLGWTLNDAFVNPVNFGGMVTYHLNEIHGVQVFASKFSAKENSYVDQIEQDTGTVLRGKVAIPKSLYLLNYQITPFYGKLSITKQMVVNTSFYGSLGVGTVQIDDKNNFTTSLGIGTKFYFTDHFNLRLDYRYLLFKARDPINIAYGDRQQFNSLLTMGLGFLF